MNFASLLKYALPAAAIAAPLAGAYLGSRTAKSAAKTLTRAADESQEIQRQQFQQNQNNLAPWLAAGSSVLPELTRGVAPGGDLVRPFGMEDFETDPGYQFRLAQGTRAIENSASARGMQLSGATLKALERYGQDLGSGEYSNAWNRDHMERLRKYNSLAGIAGLGQQATNTGINLGQNYGANAGELATQRGNALASGNVGSSNAWIGGLGQAFDNYRYQDMMKRLYPGGQGAY